MSDGFNSGLVPLGGSGSPSNTRGRARLTMTGWDSEEFLYTLALSDPQPNASDLPDDWVIDNGGLLLPAGTYWVSASLTLTPATTGGDLHIEVNFFEEWNANDNWAIPGGVGSPQNYGLGGGISTLVLPATEDESTVVPAAGVVSTGAPDRLIVVPNTPAATAAVFSVGHLFVTRLD